MLAGYLVYDYLYAADTAPQAAPVVEEEAEVITNIRPNVETPFNRTLDEPQIESDAFVDPDAVVIGNVLLSSEVFVAPGANIRGDEGGPFYIGAQTTVQGGAVIHALYTFRRGKLVEEHLVTVEGERFAVHIGKEVPISYGAQVHGPVVVGEETHVGLNAVVFDAKIGKGVSIEPGAIVMSVIVPDNVVVPARTVVATQADADALKAVPEEYHYGDLVEREVEISEGLAGAYRSAASSASSSSSHDDGH